MKPRRDISVILSSLSDPYSAEAGIPGQPERLSGRTSSPIPLLVTRFQKSRFLPRNHMMQNARYRSRDKATDKKIHAQKVFCLFPEYMQPGKKLTLFELLCLGR
ncbi:hypothetical protein [Paracoccus thiocyanatus]|uniref:hypothetical protein n=1 Tax=Paracoccus thiocyanatus TaxID=34006 RepID=UPI0015F24C2C|nr:hypothetical protein [Paracoccus thiocyanatus]